MDDDILTLQDLTDSLARCHDMEQEDADTFVRMFFKVIEESLETDKYVKVKALGTFKLIEMQGGRRISFSPDAAMRDLVNKPFAHFETVMLSDNAHFDDIREEENVSILSSEIEETLSEEEGKDLNNETIEKGSDKGDSKELLVLSASDRKKERWCFPWCMFASILLVGVCVGGGMVWNFFSSKRYVSDKLLDSLIYKRIHDGILIECSDKKDSPVSSLPIPSADSMLQSTTFLSVKTDSDTLPQQKKRKSIEIQLPVKTSPCKEKIMKPVKQKLALAIPVPQKETLSDTVEYQISGSKGSYTLKNGESLVKVAQLFWGNKRLWPYLLKHNRKKIKNPDRVPVGTILEIPVLTPKK